MYCAITFEIFLLIGFCQADPDLVIRDREMDVEAIIYGDLLGFSDLYLAQGDVDFDDDNANYDEKTKTKNDEDDKNNLSFINDIEPIKLEENTLEVKEYNSLVNTVNNLTRRYRGWWKGWTDPEEYPKDLEKEKIARVNNVSLQYLIHARYHIKKGIEQKHRYRTDNRYKIGFLFNRLRRLRYEQLKILSLVEEQADYWYWKELESTMRFYEKVVRYDVDMKDTILMIRTIERADEKARRMVTLGSTKKKRKG